MVVASPDVPLARLRDRIDDVRARGCDLHPDATEELGQAAGHLLPRRTPVHRTEDPALVGAAPERPLLPVEVPHHRIDDVRILRVHVEVGAAMAVVDEEGLAPGGSRVARDEDTAVGVRPARMSHRADEDGARVGRAHHHARDMARVGESEVPPALAAIRGLEDAATERHRVAGVGFAGADVDDIRVARLEREVTDGEGRLVLEDRVPGRARVCGLPEPSGGRADIDDVRVARHALDVGGAAHHVRRTDRAEFEALEDGGVDRGARGSGGTLRRERCHRHQSGEQEGSTRGGRHHRRWGGMGPVSRSDDLAPGHGAPQDREATP